MAEANSNLNIIVRLKDEASKPIEGFAQRIKDLEEDVSAMAKASGLAFAAFAGVITKSVYEAAKAETQFERLSHVLKTSSGATDQQVNALAEQARALEKIGVVSAENIMIMQEEAASFDLSAKSIMQLTAGAADFAVALYGVNLTSEQARQAMTGLGKALQGQLELLTKKGYQLDEDTKKVIENGTQQERVAAILKVLGSNYQDLNEVMRKTTEGGFKGLINEIDNLWEAIGTALIPIINKLGATLTPIIEKISDWVDEHPSLIAGIIAAGTTVTGFSFVLLSLVLIYIKVVKAIELVTVALKAAAGPIGWIILAIGTLVGLVSAWAVSNDKTSKEIEKLKKETEGLQGTLKTSQASIGATSKAFNDLGKEVENTRKKIAAIEKEISGTIRDNAEAQQGYKENLAQAFIDQEKKVADISEQIRERQLEGINESNAEELALLQSRLISEQNSLQSLASLRTEIAAELIEMKRRSELTEFELRVENLMRQRIKELEAFKERLQTQIEERDALRAHLADLRAQQEEYTATVIREQEQQKNAVTSTTNAIISSMSARNSALGGGSNFSSGVSAGRGSTPAFIGPRMATGGIVTSPTIAMVGEAGPEAIIPLNRAAGIGGVTINIYGDVSGEELIEKVKQGLMRGLRQDTKLSL